MEKIGVVAIYLNVGYESQLGSGRPGDLGDPGGCWFTSVNMLGHYFEFGPRLGNPALFTSKLGTTPDGTPILGHRSINIDTLPTLLQNEHLVAVPLPDKETWDTADLAENLRTYGPLLFFWDKTADGKTYGHVSVLIGADAKKREVILHDPQNRPNFHMSTADFNTVLAWDLPTGCMFRREDGEFRMKGGMYTGAVNVQN
jgi:hypothetical protein